jgi:hypothetical protein
MKYRLLTVAILLAALALFGVGMSSGGAVMLLVGAGLELCWVGALSGSKRVASTAPQAKA